MKDILVNINRITVEFKSHDFHVCDVYRCIILIESQWNLNQNTMKLGECTHAILIESQWNLNGIRKECNREMDSDINRITVEFKCRTRSELTALK